MSKDSKYRITIVKKDIRERKTSEPIVMVGKFIQDCGEHLLFNMGNYKECFLKKEIGKRILIEEC